MIVPNINYIYIKDIDTNFKWNNFNIDDKKKITILFLKQYYIKNERKLKQNQENPTHYFDTMKQELNFSEHSLTFNPIKINNNVLDQLNTSIKHLNLNTSKFIFIATEAVSSRTIDDQFWKILILKLQDLGYDIFVNLTRPSEFFSKLGCKTATLIPLDQTFALAKKAKGIISLRSGLTEILLQTNVVIFSLYTSFLKRSFFDKVNSSIIYKTFSLDKIPKINNPKFFEYDYEINSSVNIIDDILLKLK